MFKCYASSDQDLKVRSINLEKRKNKKPKLDILSFFKKRGPNSLVVEFKLDSSLKGENKQSSDSIHFLIPQKYSNS